MKTTITKKEKAIELMKKNGHLQTVHKRLRRTRTGMFFLKASAAVSKELREVEYETVQNTVSYPFSQRKDG